MLEGLVANLLESYLGKYVEGLNTQKLKVSVLAGKVELSGLSVRTDALKDFDLPFAVKSGTIGRVHLSIPWRRISSEPVVLEIEDVYVEIAPLADCSIDPEKAAAGANFDKLEALKRAEAKAVVADGGEAQVATSLAAKVVDNVQVALRRVHVRYVDETCGFVAAVSVDEVSAQSTDESWAPRFVVGAAVMHKLARVKGLRAFMGRNVRPESRVMRPLHAEARLRLSRDDYPEPKVHAAVRVDALRLDLDEEQYQDALVAASSFADATRFAHIRAYRPVQPPRSDPRAWWRYAMDGICHDWREARKEATRRAWVGLRRTRYIDLYKHTLQATRGWLPDLTDAELEELWRLEEDRRMTLRDTLELRAAAEVEAQREGVLDDDVDVHVRRDDATREARAELIEARKQYGPQARGRRGAKGGKSGAKRTGFFSWLTGGGGDEEPEVASEAATSASPHLSLGQEEREEILASLQVDREELLRAAEAKSHLPSSYKRLVVEVGVDAVAASLVAGPRSIVTAELRDLASELCVTRVATELSSSVAEVAIQDQWTQSTRFPAMVQRTGFSEGPVFSMHVQTPCLSTRAWAAVRLGAVPLQVVLAPPLISRLGHFLSPHSAAAAGASADGAASSRSSDEALASYVSSTRLRLEEAMASRSSVRVEADLPAPSLVVPVDPTRAGSEALFLDLGHLSVSSDLCNPASEAQRAAAEEKAAASRLVRALRQGRGAEKKGGAGEAEEGDEQERRIASALGDGEAAEAAPRSGAQDQYVLKLEHLAMARVAMPAAGEEPRQLEALVAPVAATLSVGVCAVPVGIVPRARATLALRVEALHAGSSPASVSLVATLLRAMTGEGPGAASDAGPSGGAARLEASPSAPLPVATAAESATQAPTTAGDSGATVRARHERALMARALLERALDKEAVRDVPEGALVAAASAILRRRRLFAASVDVGAVSAELREDAPQGGEDSVAAGHSALTARVESLVASSVMHAVGVTFGTASLHSLRVSTHGAEEPLLLAAAHSEQPPWCPSPVPGEEAAEAVERGKHFLSISATVDSEARTARVSTDLDALTLAVDGDALTAPARLAARLVAAALHEGLASTAPAAAPAAPAPEEDQAKAAAAAPDFAVEFTGVWHALAVRTCLQGRDLAVLRARGLRVEAEQGPSPTYRTPAAAASQGAGMTLSAALDETSVEDCMEAGNAAFPYLFQVDPAEGRGSCVVVSYDAPVASTALLDFQIGSPRITYTQRLVTSLLALPELVLASWAESSTSAPASAPTAPGGADRAPSSSVEPDALGVQISGRIGGPLVALPQSDTSDLALWVSSNAMELASEGGDLHTMLHNVTAFCASAGEVEGMDSGAKPAQLLVQGTEIDVSVALQAGPAGEGGAAEPPVRASAPVLHVAVSPEDVQMLVAMADGNFAFELDAELQPAPPTDTVLSDFVSLRVGEVDAAIKAAQGDERGDVGARATGVVVCVQRTPGVPGAHVLVDAKAVYAAGAITAQRAGLHYRPSGDIDLVVDSVQGESGDLAIAGAAMAFLQAAFPADSNKGSDEPQSVTSVRVKEARLALLHPRGHRLELDLARGLTLTIDSLEGVTRTRAHTAALRAAVVAAGGGKQTLGAAVSEGDLEMMGALLSITAGDVASTATPDGVDQAIILSTHALATCALPEPDSDVPLTVRLVAERASVDAGGGLHVDATGMGTTVDEQRVQLCMRSAEVGMHSRLLAVARSGEGSDAKDGLMLAIASKDGSISLTSGGVVEGVLCHDTLQATAEALAPWRMPQTGKDAPSDTALEKQGGDVILRLACVRATVPGPDGRPTAEGEESPLLYGELREVSARAGPAEGGDADALAFDAAVGAMSLHGPEGRTMLEPRRKDSERKSDILTVEGNVADGSTRVKAAFAGACATVWAADILAGAQHVMEDTVPGVVALARSPQVQAVRERVRRVMSADTSVSLAMHECVGWVPSALEEGAPSAVAKFVRLRLDAEQSGPLGDAGADLDAPRAVVATMNVEGAALDAVWSPEERDCVVEGVQATFHAVACPAVHVKELLQSELVSVLPRKAARSSPKAVAVAGKGPAGLPLRMGRVASRPLRSLLAANADTAERGLLLGVHAGVGDVVARLRPGHVGLGQELVLRNLGAALAAPPASSRPSAAAVEESSGTRAATPLAAVHVASAAVKLLADNTEENDRPAASLWIRDVQASLGAGEAALSVQTVEADGVLQAPTRESGTAPPSGAQVLLHASWSAEAPTFHVDAVFRRFLLVFRPAALQDAVEWAALASLAQRSAVQMRELGEKAGQGGARGEVTGKGEVATGAAAGSGSRVVTVSAHIVDHELAVTDAASADEGASAILFAGSTNVGLRLGAKQGAEEGEEGAVTPLSLAVQTHGWEVALCASFPCAPSSRLRVLSMGKMGAALSRDSTLERVSADLGDVNAQLSAQDAAILLGTGRDVTSHAQEIAASYTALLSESGAESVRSSLSDTELDEVLGSDEEDVEEGDEEGDVMAGGEEEGGAATGEEVTVENVRWTAGLDEMGAQSQPPRPPSVRSARSASSRLTSKSVSRSRYSGRAKTPKSQLAGSSSDASPTALQRSVQLGCRRVRLLLVADDEEGCVPLVDTRLMDTSASLGAQGLGSARAGLSASFYNARTMAWEPVLEPWVAEVEMKGKQLQVTSTRELRINCTHAFVSASPVLMAGISDAIAAVDGSAASAQPGSRRPRSMHAFAAWQVVNDTGSPLRLWLAETEDAGIGEEEEEEEEEEEGGGDEADEARRGRGRVVEIAPGERVPIDVAALGAKEAAHQSGGAGEGSGEEAGAGAVVECDASPLLAEGTTAALLRECGAGKSRTRVAADMERMSVDVSVPGFAPARALPLDRVGMYHRSLRLRSPEEASEGMAYPEDDENMPAHASEARALLSAVASASAALPQLEWVVQLRNGAKIATAQSATRVRNTTPAGMELLAVAPALASHGRGGGESSLRAYSVAVGAFSSASLPLCATPACLLAARPDAEAEQHPDALASCRPQLHRRRYAWSKLVDSPALQALSEARNGAGSEHSGAKGKTAGAVVWAEDGAASAAGGSKSRASSTRPDPLVLVPVAPTVLVPDSRHILQLDPVPFSSSSSRSQRRASQDSAYLQLDVETRRRGGLRLVLRAPFVASNLLLRPLQVRTQVCEWAAPRGTVEPSPTWLLQSGSDLHVLTHPDPKRCLAVFLVDGYTRPATLRLERARHTAEVVDEEDERPGAAGEAQSAPSAGAGPDEGELDAHDLVLADGAGAKTVLQCELLRVGACGVRAAVFAPYWLVNHTALPLTYGVPDRAGRAVTAAGGQSVPVVEDTWENQRYYPLRGWASRLLPSERWAWSDKDGRCSQARTLDSVKLPGPGWEWAGPWSVDVALGDVEGWEYAFSFDTAFYPATFRTATVRRRRWVRTRVKRSAGSGAFVSGGDAEHSGEEDVTAAATMFGPPPEARDRLCVRVKDSEWSTPIPLAATGTEGVVSVVERRRGDLARTRFQFAMSVRAELRAVGGLFKHTRMVRLAPRFAVRNASSRTLYLRQDGVQDQHPLSPGEGMAWHWWDAEGPERLRLRVLGFGWSGAFSIADLGDVTLRVRKPGQDPGAASLFFRACVESGRNGSVSVALEEVAPSATPYRFDNRLRESVALRQVGTDPKEWPTAAVDADSTLPFVWDEPTQSPLRLDVSLHGSSQQVHPDSVDSCRRIHLPALRGRASDSAEVVVAGAPYVMRCALDGLTVFAHKGVAWTPRRGHTEAGRVHLDIVGRPDGEDTTHAPLRVGDTVRVRCRIPGSGQAWLRAVGHRMVWSPKPGTPCLFRVVPVSHVVARVAPGVTLPAEVGGAADTELPPASGVPINCRLCLVPLADSGWVVGIEPHGTGLGLLSLASMRTTAAALMGAAGEGSRAAQRAAHDVGQLVQRCALKLEPPSQQSLPARNVFVFVEYDGPTRVVVASYRLPPRFAAAFRTPSRAGARLPRAALAHGVAVPGAKPRVVAVRPRGGKERSGESALGTVLGEFKLRLWAVEVSLTDAEPREIGVLRLEDVRVALRRGTAQRSAALSVQHVQLDNVLPDPVRRCILFPTYYLPRQTIELGTRAEEARRRGQGAPPGSPKVSARRLDLARRPIFQASLALPPDGGGAGRQASLGSGVVHVLEAEFLLREMELSVDEEWMRRALDLALTSVEEAVEVGEGGEHRLAIDPEGRPVPDIARFQAADAFLRRVCQPPRDASAPAPGRSESEPPSRAASGHASPTRVYVRALHLHPLQIHLSFKRVPGADAVRRGVLDARQSFPSADALRGVRRFLVSVDRAPLQLATLHLDHVFAPFNTLLRRVVAHYRSAGVHQAHRVLFAVEALGNPAGMLASVSEGVQEFFYEPSDAALGDGLSKRARSLAKHTVQGFSHGASTGLRSMAGNVAKMSMDQSYAAQREERRRKAERTNRSAGQGLAAGVMGFGQALASGATGLVRAPVDGARKEGVGGFVRGVGKGLAGAVAKPLSGAMDLAATPADTIARATSTRPTAPSQSRPPRLFVGSERVLCVICTREMLLVRRTLDALAEGAVMPREVNNEPTAESPASASSPSRSSLNSGSGGRLSSPRRLLARPSSFRTRKRQRDGLAAAAASCEYLQHVRFPGTQLTLLVTTAFVAMVEEGAGVPWAVEVRGVEAAESVGRAVHKVLAQRRRHGAQAYKRLVAGLQGSGAARSALEAIDGAGNGLRPARDAVSTRFSGVEHQLRSAGLGELDEGAKAQETRLDAMIRALAGASSDREAFGVSIHSGAEWSGAVAELRTLSLTRSPGTNAGALERAVQQIHRAVSGSGGADDLVPALAYAITKARPTLPLLCVKLMSLSALRRPGANANRDAAREYCVVTLHVALSALASATP